MTEITTHVLDTATGRPAAGVTVGLAARGAGEEEWTELASVRTDADGRTAALGSSGPGLRRLRFDLAGYYGESAFFPEACVAFRVGPDDARLHVPLLLSPYGYSTYRGS